MTTTPHPTDALPLPEPFAALSDDETPALYKRWADQIRAAHREGYELAMSNTRERLAALAEEFEAAIPTDAGLVLAAMIREGVTALGSHIGYAAQSLAAPTPDHSPGNMTQPIHDPAVTTPREVLVGESPVDRIVAPAQEQPNALRSALGAMLTQFGMDEDEWNKPTFDQARAALNGEWSAQCFDAPVYPPDGTKSPFTVINLGAGQVQMGDAVHDSRLPALWFGTNGQGMGHEELLNREALAGETLAVVTFANADGLDVLLEVIQRIRREKFPEAVEQQQAGAAEVSDEQIEKLAHRMCWQYRHSSDPHHSSTYKFNLTTLLEYTRAALKAGGVAEVSDEMISQALAAACFFDTKQSRKDMRNALEAALKAGGVA